MAQREETGRSSVDADDVARFDRIGAEWWSADGPMAALHKLNPVRVAYLRDRMSRHFRVEGLPRDRYAARPLEGLRILDAGCGAGILAEPLARLGARVTAIDPAPRNIEVARDHAEKSGLEIDYRMTTIEALSAEGVAFDAVLAMEVLEHVLDVAGFVRCCGALVRPGGLMFAATLNRTLKSFAFAIVGAEYVLGWAPRGTHDWRRFISPRELTKEMAAAGLGVFDETGVVFDPLEGGWRLARDMDINYMITASKRR